MQDTLLETLLSEGGPRGSRLVYPLWKFVITTANIFWALNTAQVLSCCFNMAPSPQLPSAESEGRGRGGAEAGARLELPVWAWPPPQMCSHWLPVQQRLSGADSFRRWGLGSGSYNNTAGAPSFPHMLNSFPSELLGKQGAPPSTALRRCTPSTFGTAAGVRFQYFLAEQLPAQELQRDIFRLFCF